MYFRILNSNLIGEFSFRIIPALLSLSNDKAAGVDGMVNEILKLIEFQHILLQIVNDGVFIPNVVPVEWLMSILVPVFRKETQVILPSTGVMIY